MAVYQFITATGTVVADTSATRNEVIAEYRQVFGQDLITDDETPEGVLINAETTSRQSVARNNATLANQINPNLAGGVFLDAIWALTGGMRNPATRSTVNATITGIANTNIPAGSEATTTGGDTFRTVVSVTIPVSGTLANVAFESVEVGEIDIGASTLTTVSGDVLGWETVNNPAAGTRGQATESDEASRQRRRLTLGLQGRSVAAAVQANVLEVPGVQSLAFRENITNMTQVIDGITLVPHSIWAAVQGGADADIGLALLRSKTAGSNWNGTSSVDVIEPASGQSYTVRFQRPTTVAMAVRLMVRRTSNVSDPITAARESVLRYARGEIPGETGFSIGSDVSPFEVASAVNRDNPAIFVVRSEVAAAAQTPAWSTDTFTIDTDELATIIPADIVVQIV